METPGLVDSNVPSDQHIKDIFPDGNHITARVGGKMNQIGSQRPGQEEA